MSLHRNDGSKQTACAIPDVHKPEPQTCKVAPGNSSIGLEV